MLSAWLMLTVDYYLVFSSASSYQQVFSISLKMNRSDLINSISEFDQRNFIKIEVLLGKCATDIHKDLVKAIGGSAYSLRTVQFWVKAFYNGRISTEEGRGGPHNLAPEHEDRIAAVKDKLDEKKDWTVVDLSHELQIPKTSVHRILTKTLNMHKVIGKWIPHVPTEKIIEERCSAASQNLLLLRQHPHYLRGTLAVDESWVFLYRAPERDQCRFWVSVGEEPPQVPRQHKAEHKRMLIVAMDFNGIAFWHLYDEGETVTADRYISFLDDVVKEFKMQNKIKNVVLLHDNARPHKARIVSEFLLKNHILTWNQPPYSPDLIPPDFGCFHHLKRALSGRHFSEWSDLYGVLEVEIHEGNRNGTFQGVRKLEERWAAVIEKNGDYL